MQSGIFHGSFAARWAATRHSARVSLFAYAARAPARVCLKGCQSAKECHVKGTKRTPKDTPHGIVPLSYFIRRSSVSKQCVEVPCTCQAPYRNNLLARSPRVCWQESFARICEVRRFGSHRCRACLLRLAAVFGQRWDSARSAAWKNCASFDFAYNVAHFFIES